LGKLNQLLQLRVLRLGLLQDRDVGVGVFPKGEEILIRSAGFTASGVFSIALDGLRLDKIRASQSQTGQRTPGKVPHHATVVNELLKFCCRLVAMAESEISFTAHVDRD